MAPQIPPLDEQEFDQPALIGGLPNQNLHQGNNLFWYFTSSPWFEPSCNNISVFLAAQQDPNTFQLVTNDRKIWDEKLKDIPRGTQFVLAGEGQGGEDRPWLLQRQNKVEKSKRTWRVLFIRKAQRCLWRRVCWMWCRVDW
jgi:mediator of RNA polymerase II transcription subunit 6